MLEEQREKMCICTQNGKQIARELCAAVETLKREDGAMQTYSHPSFVSHSLFVLSWKYIMQAIALINERELKIAAHGIQQQCLYKENLAQSL